MDQGHQGVLSLKELQESLEIAQPSHLYVTMDLSAAFRTMCVEYARGGPAGHLNYNINGGNCYHNNNTFASSNESDSERSLTYHEYVAAAMINRIALSDERVMLAFSCLDIEKFGTLTADGIRLALGDDLMQGSIDSMLSSAVQGATTRGAGDSSLPTNTNAAKVKAPGPVSMNLNDFLSNWRHGLRTRYIQT
jgi:hypothetical protein